MLHARESLSFMRQPDRHSESRNPSKWRLELGGRLAP